MQSEVSSDVDASLNIFFIKFIRIIYMLKYLHINATFDFIFRSVYIDFNIGSVSYVFLGRNAICYEGHSIFFVPDDFLRIDV